MRGQACGFTLIELSIVLVIIGLIVGGILVGQDLIKSAEVRAQISQIEKYNSAVNTFKGKYGGLAGDLGAADAQRFGFSRPNVLNSLNDGLIDGHTVDYQTEYEAQYFWMDLNTAKLVDGQFLYNVTETTITLSTTVGSRYLGNYLPAAKIGNGNFVYVYSTTDTMRNWYGVYAFTSIAPGSGVIGKSTIPVIQAYNIDKKLDDGLPISGSVEETNVSDAIDNDVLDLSQDAQTVDSAISCYNTTSNAYSISSLADYGKHGNCALSFRFQ